VADEVQGNKARVMNWILDNCGDRVLILDDDIQKIGWFTSHDIVLYLMEEDLMAFIENGFQMCEDAGIKMWGLNVTYDKRAYKEFNPFKLKGVILGPWTGHNCNDLRYDESLDSKEDYDMSLQVLNKYRRTLRFQAFHYLCDQAGSGGVLTGGFAQKRTIEYEKKMNERLLKKWGSKIVRVDMGQTGPKLKRKRTKYDVNMLVRVPIRGI
jgi:hypothetical protein